MPLSDGRRDAVLECTFDKQSTNVSLWLDKCLGGPTRVRDTGELKPEDTKSFLEKPRTATIPRGYKEAFQRRKESLEVFTGGFEDGGTRFLSAKAEGRFVCGIGMASVWENSLSLLRPWGVPYLPGSSLKGVAAAAAHAFGGDSWRKAGESVADSEPGVDHKMLFGTTEAAGAVVFHDAWFVASGKSEIHLDVITTHHKDYYGGAADAAPLDSDSPTPITFLSTSGTYEIAVSGPEPWVEAALGWLELGLKELGLGAKTNAGYGRFSCQKLASKVDGARQDLEKAIEDRRFPTEWRQRATVAMTIQSQFGWSDPQVAQMLEMARPRDKWLARARGDNAPEAAFIRRVFGALEAIHAAKVAAPPNVDIVAAMPALPTQEAKEERWAIAKRNGTRTDVVLYQTEEGGTGETVGSNKLSLGNNDPEIIQLLAAAKPIRVLVTMKGTRPKKLEIP